MDPNTTIHYIYRFPRRLSPLLSGNEPPAQKTGGGGPHHCSKITPFWRCPRHTRVKGLVPWDSALRPRTILLAHGHHLSIFTGEIPAASDGLQKSRLIATSHCCPTERRLEREQKRGRGISRGFTGENEMAERSLCDAMKEVKQRC